MTPDSQGGVAIKLVRARYLLTAFGPGGAQAFSYRQQLEAEQPEAYADKAMIARVLREVEERQKDSFDPAYGKTMGMGFPALTAMSHCWLGSDHPDIEGRNLREIWLPALEWYYSERVRRAVYLRKWGGWLKDGTTLKDGTGTHENAVPSVCVEWTGLSDEQLMDACDFCVFIDALSIVQKGAGGERTEEEARLFQRALHNLDVVYAHKGAVSFSRRSCPRGMRTGPRTASAMDDLRTARVRLIKSYDQRIDLGKFEQALEATSAQPSEADISEAHERGSHGPAERAESGEAAEPPRHLQPRQRGPCRRHARRARRPDARRPALARRLRPAGRNAHLH